MRIFIASIATGGGGRSAYQATRDAAIADLDEGGLEIVPSWHPSAQMRAEFKGAVRRLATARHVASSYVDRAFQDGDDRHLHGLAACMEQRGATIREQRKAAADYVGMHWDSLTVRERDVFLKADLRNRADMIQGPSASGPAKTGGSFASGVFWAVCITLLVSAFVWIAAASSSTQAPDDGGNEQDSTSWTSEEASAAPEPSSDAAYAVGEPPDAAPILDATEETSADLPGDPLSGPPPAISSTSVGLAVASAGTVYARSGAEGARARSQICHEDAKASPTWSTADACVAFDLAARRLDASRTSTEAGDGGRVDLDRDRLSEAYPDSGRYADEGVRRIRRISATVDSLLRNGAGDLGSQASYDPSVPNGSGTNDTVR